MSSARKHGVLLAAVLAAGPASAADLTPYERLIDALQVKKNMIAGATAGANLAATLNPNVPEETRRDVESISKVWLDEFGKSLNQRWPLARTIYVAKLGTILSPGEAGQLADYFSSPIGQKFIATQQLLTTNLAAELNPWVRTTACAAVAPARARMPAETASVRAVAMSTQALNSVWTQFGCASTDAKPF